MRQRRLWISHGRLGRVVLALPVAGMVLTACAAPVPAASSAPASGALESSSLVPLSTAPATVGIALTSQQLASAAQWVARAAASTGDVHQGSGTAVLSRRGAAIQLITPGDTVDSNRAVIVVLVHGKFDGSVFDHPPGVTVPGGDEMLASFDATTGQVEDFTLLDTAHGRQAPDLRTLGPVSNLPAS
ncbi:MAG TPA: hypothetical protein VIJ96_10880 [Acidothermaceae bacterium]